MQIDFEKVLALYGVKGLVMVGVFLLLKQVVKTDWFSKWWSRTIDRVMDFFFKKDDSKSISESDILNHDIFNYIDFWINSKVPTFQFSTDYRTIVFKKYLCIFLKNYKQELSKFVKDTKYQSMDQSELWKALLDLINNVIYCYEKEAEDSGIPRIVIIKMKSKNNDTIVLTIGLIENISNSQFYQSDKNFLKMYSILNIILSILESTISNSEDTCNSINGQLSGLSITEGGRSYEEP